MPHQKADFLTIPSLFMVQNNGEAGFCAVILFSFYLMIQIKLDLNVAGVRLYMTPSDHLDLGRPFQLADLALALQ